MDKKAFNWKREFTPSPSGRVGVGLREGLGFDIIVGNPPYGAKLDNAHINYFTERYGKYGITKRLNDTYFIFTAYFADKLLKNGGRLGFITPNTWRLVDAASEYRAFMLSNFNFIKIVQHAEKVFSDATVDCDTFIIEKSFLPNNKTILIKQTKKDILSYSEISQQDLNDGQFINPELSTLQRNLVAKIMAKSVLVKDILTIKNGVKPYEKGKGKPAQTAKTMLEKPFTANYKKDKTFIPLIGGSNFNKYVNLWNDDEYISYGEWLAAPRDADLFFSKNEKLIFRQTSDKLIGVLIEDGFVMRNNTHIILKKNEDYDLLYILALLNSKLLDFVYWSINPEKGEALAQVKLFHLGMLPIKQRTQKEQQQLADLAKKMLFLHKEVQNARLYILNHLQTVFDDKIVLNKKINNWHEHSWYDLLNELQKQKLTFMPKQTTETQKAFEQKKREIQGLQTQIAATDQEINGLVYQVYELFDDEIALVEKS